MRNVRSAIFARAIALWARGGGGSRVSSFLSGPTTLRRLVGRKGHMENGKKAGKIGHAGIFGGNGGPKCTLFLSGAAGVLADESPVGHKRRHRKRREIGPAGIFGGNGGPKWTFLLSGAAGGLADVGPVGHKRRHGKGGIGSFRGTPLRGG
jgi:hypothetical protein